MRKGLRFKARKNPKETIVGRQNTGVIESAQVKQSADFQRVEARGLKPERE